MVLVWIGVALGILVVLILIVKLLKTPSHESVQSHCQICGDKINGLKCPKCSKNNSFGR